MSVYNDAERVGCAVKSIGCQTLRDWELIVVNDGSTDATGEVVDRLAADDARVRVVHQENTGLTQALTVGCRQAEGKYIARQDSDDWSHPQRLTEQVELLESDERVGFVSCWTQYVGPEDEPLELVLRPPDPELATRQLLDEQQGPPAHGSVMFRRELYEQVGGYRPEFYFGQDADLWLRMAEHGWIAYVQSCRYSARREVNSVSGAMRGRQKQFGRLGQTCREARRDGLPEQPYVEQAAGLTQQIIAGGQSHRRSDCDETSMAYLIGSQLARNGDNRAKRYLWSAIKQRPWHWRAWARLAQSLVGGRTASR